MRNTQELKRIIRACRTFLVEHGGNIAVTLAFNNHNPGTHFPCFRVVDGERRFAIPRARGRSRGKPWAIGQAYFVPMNRIMNELDELHRDVDRDLFGSRFHLKGEDRRSDFIGTVEHLDSNVHVHLLWRQDARDSDEVIDLIQRHWNGRSGFYSSRACVIDDLPGWVRYMTKDMWFDPAAAQDRIVWSRKLNV